MNTMMSLGRRRHIREASLCLLVVALLAGLTGCVGETSRSVKYDLTIASGEGGSVTVPGEGTFACDSGRVVDLVATPTSGYRFLKWTGSVGTIANPNAASTTITMNGNYTITATFEETEGTYYTLTMAKTGSGSTSPAVGEHPYAAGTVVTIQATPATGYRFDSWTGDVSTIDDPDATSTTITIYGSYSITANFEVSPLGQHSLTVSSTAGGSVNITIGGEDTVVGPGQTQTISDITAGTEVDLVATPDTIYHFVNWTGAPVNGTTSSTTTFSMQSDYSITANFMEGPPPLPGQYTLHISSTAGGSVNITIGGEDTVVGPGQTQTISDITAGTEVDLVATPDTIYHFVNWTGAPVNGTTSSTTTFSMQSDYSITANFMEGPPLLPGQYTLHISSTAGGYVTTPGEGTFARDANSTVNLEASPYTGYQFDKWTGDVATIADDQNPSTTITMSGNYSIVANFEAEDGEIIPDAKLEAAIRQAIGKPTGPIYESDLEGLTSLSATYQGITDLTGLEHCINLNWLDLRHNHISDISPLADLIKLTSLDLSYNQIAVVSPLENLTGLKYLYLHNNLISDISPLANLTSLLYLYLHSNQVSDIEPLANLTELRRLLLFSNNIGDSQLDHLVNLTNLQWLYLNDNNEISNLSHLAGLTKLIRLDLSDNDITDISYLAGLTKLTWLYLRNNQISDIEPLVENDGLGTGDEVYLDGNPLSGTSIDTYVPQLVARGVVVSFD